MTPQEIQERNKQIALMLGWKNSFAHKVDQYGYYQTVDGYSTPYINTLDEQAVEYQSDKNAFAIEDLQFHSDWNWVMEAVEFIQSLRLDIPEYNVVDYYIVTSSSTFCNIRSGLNHADGETKSPFFYNKSSVGKNQKEAVFIAVSDFAKLYNEKKL
jgi:hypothetical protein